MMSASNRAALLAANTGRPCSAETRTKISAALAGRKATPETVARLRALHLGKKRGPYSKERCAAISAAKIGKPQTAAHRAANSSCRIGHVNSAATRAAISAANKGKKRPQISIGMKRAWEEGRHPVNKSYSYTSLAQALHAHLREQGLTVEPEVRFGRFTVDLYDREHHTAYEADGTYWHERNEAKRPNYQVDRDSYLLERFKLRVIHHTDIDIREMTRRAG